MNIDNLKLTETSILINLGDYYNVIASEELPNYHDGIEYKVGERRTVIFTKYKVNGVYKPTDAYTSSVCELKTPSGELIVYGTIIGILEELAKGLKKT